MKHDPHKTGHHHHHDQGGADASRTTHAHADGHGDECSHGGGASCAHHDAHRKHGEHHSNHEHGHGHGVTPSSAAKYFCPMCEGVESDQPGDCPKCGRALERNPAHRSPSQTIWTCPMHPEIKQDHPGAC